MTDLLLAALDEVSARRLERYSGGGRSAESPAQLVAVAAQIFREDLDEGYVTVLVEMMAGSDLVPALGERWRSASSRGSRSRRQVIDPALTGHPFATVVPTDDAAYAVVALYLGLELLSHLDGDRSRALALFERASTFAALFDAGTTSPLEA